MIYKLLYLPTAEFVRIFGESSPISHRYENEINKNLVYYSNSNSLFSAPFMAFETTLFINYRKKVPEHLLEIIEVNENDL